MSVARGDDDHSDRPSGGTGPQARRRPLRRVGEGVASSSPPARPAPPAAETEAAPAPAGTTVAATERRPPEQRRGSGPPARLDDLYRLAMPKLFQLAEREGLNEHTGMTRVQLIVSIVRRQIERGEVVRGSGTLEVLPDGYGFLRSAAH